jgi:hypothetical protein
MPPSTGRARKTFTMSLRLLLLGVVVVTFISLPLRTGISSNGSMHAAAGSIVVKQGEEDVPSGDDHAVASLPRAMSASVVNHGPMGSFFLPPSSPLETLPELHFTFPKESFLDTLFTSGDVLLNKTHLFPQQVPPTLEKSGKRFDRYHNPYTPLETAHTPCKNGAHLSGRWVHDAALTPKYPSYGEILGCCQRGFEAAGHSAEDIRLELKYRWESDSCDLFDWSEEKFCKALRGRDMMIAGDSLNDHWHASLYYLLGGRKDIYKREGTVRGKRACGTHEICHKYYPKPLRLYFLTNQLLQEERRLFRNYKWWKYIRGYPILILNAGSWMRDPADETRFVSDEEYFKHMTKAYAIVRKLYNGTVIWRTTYQGHPFCWNYKEPLTEELRPEDFPRVPPYLRYRWWAIPYRNNFTTQLWREGGAHILDVARMTNLMPLGHLGQNHPKFAVKNTTDCVHYCSPGPVYDTWSTLLMNLLMGNLEDTSVSRAASQV